jgi:thiamine-monophosphate kinase
MHIPTLIERQLKPEASERCSYFHALEIKPTSMIISDGFLKLCICKQSNVGCNLYEDKLPLDPQLISV